MDITINKIDSHEVDGNVSDIISTFDVVQNGRKFRITCRSNRYGRSLGMEEKDGLLYINRDDNMVHWQVVALGGGCGLLIDDDPIEGLSPWALRGVIFAEKSKEAREIVITTEQSGDIANQPLLLIDGIAQDLSNWK